MKIGPWINARNVLTRGRVTTPFGTKTFARIALNVGKGNLNRNDRRIMERFLDGLAGGILATFFIAGVGWVLTGFWILVGPSIFLGGALVVWAMLRVSKT